MQVAAWLLERLGLAEPRQGAAACPRARRQVARLQVVFGQVPSLQLVFQPLAAVRQGFQRLVRLLLELVVRGSFPGKIPT